MSSPYNFSLNHHLDLPDDVFRLLREQIYKRSGMWFSDSSKYLLQKRLSPRARELSLQVGESPELPNIVWGLWVYYLTGGPISNGCLRATVAFFMKEVCACSNG